MSDRISLPVSTARVSPGTAGLSVAVLLVGYWLSVLLDHAVFGLLQAGLGLFLWLFLPGAVVRRLLGVPRRWTGSGLLFSVALSAVLGTVLVVVSGTVLGSLGVSRPLSTVPLGVVLTLFLVALVGVSSLWGIDLRLTELRPPGSLPAVGALSVLPFVAAFAAVLMGQFEIDLGMFLFGGAVVLVVLVSATGLFERSLYPYALFSISLSVLLSRNLLTETVVGADVQSLYAVTEQLSLASAWSPGLGGSQIALPLVTAFPAAVATLTGLPVVVAFKLVAIFLFSLVPVGIYYLASELFDREVALYGALVFLFFHGSFYFTPGKQLLAELFLVLVLLALFTEPSTTGRTAVVGLLSVGLVFSHYGVTVVAGLSLAVAVAAARTGRRLFGRSESRIPGWYPPALLGFGIAWYAYASPDVVALLVTVPEILLDQVVALLGQGRTIESSGASYVAQQRGLLNYLNVVLYVLMSGLLAVGLGWHALGQCRALRRGERPDGIEYTAFSVPLFVLLGVSYFFVLPLWADRVYQMVLVVLAPFVPLGVRAVGRLWRNLAGRAGDAKTPRGRTVLVALCVALFAFNSGFVFALAGAAQSSNFDAGANDLVFTADERAGVAWLESNATLDRTDEYRPLEGTALQVDDPDRVQVYTDTVTAQMFRSSLPEAYYRVEIVHLKNSWRPEIDHDRIDTGYIFVRNRSVAPPATGDVRPSQLSPAEVRALRDHGTVVYHTDAVEIIRVSNP